MFFVKRLQIRIRETHNRGNLKEVWCIKCDFWYWRTSSAEDNTGNFIQFILSISFTVIITKRVKFPRGLACFHKAPCSFEIYRHPPRFQNRSIEKFKMPVSAVVLGYSYKSFSLCDALSVPVPPELVWAWTLWTTLKRVMKIDTTLSTI